VRDDVDIWSMDEVHFQQYGSACRIWVPPETRNPVLIHHPTRKSIGCFGAVRLRDGKFEFRIEPDKFNAMTCWEFFIQLRKVSWQSRRKVYILLDNARYHHATIHRPWREKQEPEFEMLYLPPYSPDMNPIERVWKLTRRLCIHNRHFSLLDGIVDAIDPVFMSWQQPNETLRRLCAIT
jgi:transposase